MIENLEDPESSVSGPSSPWGSRGAGWSCLAELQPGLRTGSSNQTTWERQRPGLQDMEAALEKLTSWFKHF